MELKKTHFLGTVFLGTVIGFVICKMMGKKKSAFDGDEVNSYADGAGGTADTTQTLANNMPIHNEKDARGVHGKRSHKIHSHKVSGKHGAKVKEFFDAYNNKNSPAYLQAAKDWFEYKHPGAAEFTDADALAFFKANGDPKVRLVQLGWAKRHNITDPKAAVSFWSNSLTNGDPAQMDALYHAFYPERHHSKAHRQSMPTGNVKGDMAFSTKNDVV